MGVRRAILQPRLRSASVPQPVRIVKHRARRGAPPRASAVLCYLTRAAGDGG